jgi:Dyp-type peroxidase family
MIDPADEDGAGAELIALVERTEPGVVRLACAVSLAVRIEPALVRRIRLEIERGLPVAVEADLWFSALVSSYSPRAFVLDARVAPILRRRLAQEGGRCAVARRIVRELHEHAPPTIRLEEEILYRALTGDEPDKIDVALGRALNTLNEVPARADAVARWAAHALPSLPLAAGERASARRLAARAQMRLDRGSAIAVGIDLLAGGIEVRHPADDDLHQIELPAQEPWTLLVRAPGSSAPPHEIVVQADSAVRHRVRVARDSPPGFDIETADGSIHELRPAPAAGSGRIRLDLADIQGDILRAYGNDYDHTTYAFVTIDCPPEQARAWFSGLLEHVTTAAPWSEGKPLTTLNVALTATGLAALGVSPVVAQSFSHAFRHGMAQRSALLGDVGPSDPSRWEQGLGSGEAHVLLTINAQEREHLERALRKMRAALDDAGGIRVVFQQDAELLAGVREHFGYADGFSQPAIEGASDARELGGGVPVGAGRWRALAPGEFVLGYPDEETRDDPQRRLPSAPSGPLGRSGTYMVWRKLYQDVALWRRVLRDASASYSADGDEQLLAAKVVGRWPNGTPLVKHPDKPGPNFDPAARGANDFRYSGDLDGRRCPIGAHIRRANPRDALGFDAKLTHRHRMIRRGMPYGPPLPEGETRVDHEDRGLVFVSFQANISRQFESVQIQWLNDGNIFGLGHDRDFVLGSPEGRGKMTIQGDPPFFLHPQETFVSTRGGEYLFVPGITALHAIAAGTTG